MSVVRYVWLECKRLQYRALESRREDILVSGLLGHDHVAQHCDLSFILYNKNPEICLIYDLITLRNE